jgi:hypothetical protein
MIWKIGATSFVCKIEADELKRANTAAYEEAMKKAGGALFFT